MSKNETSPTETSEVGPADTDAAVRAVDEGLASFEITLLPMSESKAGLFVYEEASIDLVKDLRSAGVDVGFAHEPADRTFHAERSAEIAVAFIINIASAAAWEALMISLELYRARKRLKVTLVEKTAADGSTKRTVDFDGSGDEVLEAMKLYLDKGSSS